MFIDASNLVFPSQVSDASLPVGLPDRWRVPLVLTLLPLPPLSHPQPLALGALIFQRLISTVGLQPLRGPVRRFDPGVRFHLFLCQFTFTQLLVKARQDVVGAFMLRIQPESS